MSATKLCSIPGCWKAAVRRGYCWGHYHRWRTYGDPTAGRTQQGELLRWIDQVALKCFDDDCLFWPYGRGDDGYARAYVNKRVVPASRYICELVNGEPPTPEHQAAHSCGRGHEGCVNPRHLSWKTPTENQSDRLVHNTHGRGERCKTAVLTEAHVHEIRKLGGSMPASKIAKRLSVSVHAVRQVLSRRTWAWLE